MLEAQTKTKKKTKQKQQKRSVSLSGSPKPTRTSCDWQDSLQISRSRLAVAAVQRCYLPSSPPHPLLCGCVIFFSSWFHPLNAFLLPPQTRTTPCCATSVTTRSWWSRRSPRDWAGRAGGIPLAVPGARAAIPAAPASPSAPPCCPPHSASTSRLMLCLYVRSLHLFTPLFFFFTDQ